MPQYKCRHCNDVSDRKGNMERHMRTKHNDFEPLKGTRIDVPCDVISVNSKKSSKVIVKMYSCPHCDEYSSDRAPNIARHIKTVHGVKGDTKKQKKQSLEELYVKLSKVQIKMESKLRQLKQETSKSKKEII